ncbi:hypothetical protein CXG81DRAFT_17423 [Caulochytrium protostelioides]|uniref:Ser-Thr-rich glycosyl-phosphatidyl-inositol-anchored membrane family-domain-containing protein n=1 Tax=Caulochytrium protostelioides TaxID=1555241 RepID=A0A4P9XC49_9FUNG|nr:hypothetical protein CXG81DRAFT_17423 [Caulochytrium protostelioides]|eukprot:RKP02982.1 hypothetical protein CXG81DRAFT_17423 [Caulochytrium protostelioides]
MSPRVLALLLLVLAWSGTVNGLLRVTEPHAGSRWTAGSDQLVRWDLLEDSQQTIDLYVEYYAVATPSSAPGGTARHLGQTNVATGGAWVRLPPDLDPAKPYMLRAGITDHWSFGGPMDVGVPPPPPSMVAAASTVSVEGASPAPVRPVSNPSSPSVTQTSMIAGGSATRAPAATGGPTTISMPPDALATTRSVARTVSFRSEAGDRSIPTRIPVLGAPRSDSSAWHRSSHIWIETAVACLATILNLL